MQILLNDIEQDVQELKWLVMAVTKTSDSGLRVMAGRKIQQVKIHLDELQTLLNEASTTELNVVSVASIEPELPLKVDQEPIASIQESVQSVSVPTSSILAERIKCSTDLRHSISLNDSFRFTRELFEGDASRMNDVVRRLGEASTLNEAIDLFKSETHFDEENEAVIDFMELLKKYFS